MARSLPIVGRAVEQAAISAAYERAAVGQSQLLLITGPAGIGKTRLTEELARRSGQAGAQLLTGESAPLAGAALAFGPFVDALGERAGWLLAGDGPGDMLAARHRLFVRMLGLLTELAASAPLVLILEDLHWADESSRELLAFLTVRLRQAAVLVAATLREDDLASDARRWLAELEHRPAATRLRLTGLADTEIGELVTSLLPAGASADRVAAVVSAAEGNPLYARELASAGPHQTPASVADAVLAKAAGLAAPARALVDQVCVADRGMSHELLAATVPLPEEPLLASARQAVGSGLLVASGDGYACPHALIRQVLYAHLLPGDRHRLHRRLAAALAARADADPGLLAQHWRLAACPPQAAAAAVVAARQAVSARAYPEADRHYALAIELAQWLPDSVPGLLEEAAQAASWAGDPERAAEWAAQALARSGAAAPADRARLLERIGRYRYEAVPSGAAATVDKPGAHSLAPGTDLARLRQDIGSAMTGGTILTLPIDNAGPNAARVLGGASLAYAVLCPAS